MVSYVQNSKSPREDFHGALAGVCGGVAEYFNVDANLVRLIWVALCFAGTAGLWLYVAAALLLPKKSQVYPGW